MGWTRRSAAVSVLLVMDEHRKQAGDRLAQLRDAQGLSQEELAHLAGISVKTISRFENGRHDGRRGTVRALAKALKVNEQDIIGEPPAPLGLGPTQLDRIEQLLEGLVSRVAALELGATLDMEDDPPDEHPERRAAKPVRKTRSRRES